MIYTRFGTQVDLIAYDPVTERITGQRQDGSTVDGSAHGDFKADNGWAEISAALDRLVEDAEIPPAIAAYRSRLAIWDKELG